MLQPQESRVGPLHPVGESLIEVVHRALSGQVPVGGFKELVTKTQTGCHPLVDFPELILLVKGVARGKPLAGEKLVVLVGGIPAVSGGLALGTLLLVEQGDGVA